MFHIQCACTQLWIYGIINGNGKGYHGKRSRRQPSCAHDSAAAPKEKGPKSSKRSRISGPYIPYGLFQTKGKTCAKFGSDRFRNVYLYKFHTNKQTFIFIYKIFISNSTKLRASKEVGCESDRKQFDDESVLQTKKSPVHISNQIRGQDIKRKTAENVANFKIFGNDNSNQLAN